MSTDDKIDFVAILIDWEKSTDKYTFINSLLRSIETKELIEVYWDSINKGLKPIVHVIQHQLVERLSQDKGIKLKPLIQQTIKNIENNNHRESRKIRSLLTKSVKYLTKPNRLNIFHSLIFDEKKANRNLAYKAISGLIDENIESKLLESLDKNFDDQCLTLLVNETDFIENIPSEFLLELINTRHIKEWIKRKAIISLGLRNFSNVEFLKDKDPTTYLYIASKAKIEIDNKWIMKKIKTLSSPSQLSVFIYSIGELKKFKLLKRVFKEYDEIKKKMFERHFEG